MNLWNFQKIFVQHNTSILEIISKLIMMLQIMTEFGFDSLSDDSARESDPLSEDIDLGYGFINLIFPQKINPTIHKRQRVMWFWWYDLRSDYAPLPAMWVNPGSFNKTGIHEWYQRIRNVMKSNSFTLLIQRSNLSLKLLLSCTSLIYKK